MNLLERFNVKSDAELLAEQWYQVAAELTAILKK